MKIKATDTFIASLQKLIDSNNWWTISYWSTKYYDLKRALWALRRYFWIVTKMVPWDSGSVIQMMRFQIEILADYIEKAEREVSETRIPKIQKMRRFVELADHKLADDYADRCGYNYEHGFDFVPSENHPGSYEMVSTAPPEVEQSNTKAIIEARQLEEGEWNEMIECLRDMRSWWD
jgi:hypothetical protein